MKKQKLYIKNEKGRYEEYKPEMKTDDGNLFFLDILPPLKRVGFLDAIV